MIPAATCAALLLLALADEPAPLPPPVVPPVAAFIAAGDDAAQDLVILGETRPIFLRLRALVGDRAFRSAATDAARGVHARLDADGDGKLTVAEAEANGLSVLIGAAAPARGRTEVDTNPKDGVIALDELAEALDGPAEAFRVQADDAADRRTDALFDHLDRDKDGAITRPELAAVAGTFRQLDRDDDEWVAVAEVAPVMAPVAPRRPGRDGGAPTVISLAAGESPLRLIRALLKKYDTGSSRSPGKPDGKLTPDEFAIAAPAFTAADTNTDGLLTSDELRRWLATNPVDAVFDVALTAATSGEALIRVRAIDGSAPPGFVVRQLADDRVEVEVGAVRLNFQVDDGAGGIATTRRTLRDQFQAADSTQDGYLATGELVTDNGQPSLFTPLFRPIDRDHDGKLYPHELDDFITHQAAAARGRLALTAANEGRSVFGMLDGDGDRRLGAREVLATFARLTACDRDRDGRVTPAEVPHHIHLTLTRGDLSALLSAPGGNANAVVLTPVAGSPLMIPSSRPATGPPWFRKMDRNHDGDVSRREFLGTPTQFDRLDRDHDGLLAPTEADAQ